MEAKRLLDVLDNNWRSISLLRAMSTPLRIWRLAVVWQRGVRWCV